MNLYKERETIEKYFNRIKGEGYSPQLSYQGISLENISNFLNKIDRYSDDIRDSIFCLINDELPNPYSKIKTIKSISAGASTAQIGSYIGILLRGNTDKKDREGRDNWLKPLIEIDILEPVTLVDKTFVLGHITAKSPNSAYRLKNDFIELLKKSNNNNFDKLVKQWFSSTENRNRLAITYAKNEGKPKENSHKALIDDSINIYAKHYLPGYTYIFKDADDGDRISAEEQQILNKFKITFGSLADVWPDVILYNEEKNSLWFIEAVTSDGEVDSHKLKGFKSICKNSNKIFGGCTTTYLDWKKYSNRQKTKNNLARGSFVWIKEFPEKQMLIQ